MTAALTEAVKVATELAHENKLGVTLRESLQAVGQPVNEPEVPDCVAYLYEWFWRLANRSGSNGFARTPVSYNQIYYFCKLEKIELSSWELEQIETMDQEFSNALALLNKKQGQNGG